MRTNKSDLMIITSAKNLARYVITITEGSPKKFRHTFINKMHSYVLAIIENLYFANEVAVIANNEENYIKRSGYQKEALVKLKLLDYIALLAYEAKCILFRQYEQIAKQTTECIDLLNRWLKSDAKRFQIIVQ